MTATPMKVCMVASAVTRVIPRARAWAMINRSKGSGVSPREVAGRLAVGARDLRVHETVGANRAERRAGEGELAEASLTCTRTRLLGAAMTRRAASAKRGSPASHQRNTWVSGRRSTLRRR